jgi:DNA-binding MarR family transcriptional regulator
LHVQRAARALARRYDEALARAGLTHGQFSLLMSLNRAEAPAIGDVATLLGMDRTTVTANLKPLQRRRLIRIDADANDRRSRVLKLTEAGREALLDALPAWRRMQAKTAKLLRDSDPERLRAALRALS